MKTLKYGDKGSDVKTLQRRLNLYVDGIFGPITLEAVKQFQKENSLIVDGVVGPTTWGALGYTSRKIKEIILHCSATPEGRDFTVSDIRRWHLQRGFSDIGYHYVIYRNGTICKGRNIDKVGAHCEGHNTYSVGICYIGGMTFDGKEPKDTRTVQQKKSLVRLVKNLMEIHNLNASDVHCHYEFANKACPSFKIETFREELK